MKKTALIPLAAVLVIACIAIVSCQKELPVQSSANGPVTSTAVQRYIGGSNWNTLYYFGTYDSFYGCITPCGFCHATPTQIGYVPNGDDPDNNEALAEISVINGGTLLVSVDLSDIGNYYVNDIVTTGQYNVSRFTSFPQDVVNDACDAVGVPHWGGPVGISAGNYPVHIESTGGDARLEIEGVYDGATGWSWQFFVR
jgi:hypothetical protein